MALLCFLRCRDHFQRLLYEISFSNRFTDRIIADGDVAHLASGARFRLAGAVVPGSVHETNDGVTFDVTDGNATVAVVHKGDPPELFKEGAPVVCEGRWGSGAAFDSERIMIKHGNEYTPPKVVVTTTVKP